MIVIPAGSFEMGVADEGARADSDATPRHTVTIGRPFAVGSHEVTRGEFAKFVEATSYPAGDDCHVHAETSGWKNVSGAGWRNPGFEQTPDDPVVCVSWNDAQAYASWLARRTGQPYRLPSEAEWEYAAGADARLGREEEPLTHDVANYGADECCGPKTAGKDRWSHTAPAGSFAANAFGVYDLRGNAWEWLADCYHDSYRGAPADGTARTSDCSAADRRGVRGGGWGDDASLLRVTYRLRAPLDGRYFTLGFRIARDL